jgi:hypothetical protein
MSCERWSAIIGDLVKLACLYRPIFPSVSHINALCKRQSENLTSADIWKKMLTNQYSMQEQIKAD